MSDWISVEERLPETGNSSVYGSDWCLGVVDYLGEIYVELVKYVDVPKPYWKDPFDDRSLIVTHWMPLPEPPKESN